MADVLQERVLLQRIAEGDEKAFRVIFDRYKERFFAVALKMTRSGETAAEIVQETFVALWLRRSALDKVENPSSYLFTIAYHHIYAWFKQQALEKQLKKGLSEQSLQREAGVEEQLNDKDSFRLLYQIIGQLPPQQQLIYKLNKIQGLSRDEIAEHLHISPHTVKNHLQQAVKFVRSHFNKMGFLISFFLF